MAKLLSKKIKKRLETIFVPPVAYALLSLIYLTCKKRYHYDKSRVKQTPAIFVLWHGEASMLALGYRDYRSSTSIEIIVSKHHDGEIATRILHLFGLGTIRGSTSDGGVSALKGAFRALKQNRDIGITTDGPRGPRHSVSDGVVAISQKKDTPIIALNFQASKAWRLKSWDKFAIPKPFCTLDYYYSDPFYVRDESMDSAKQIIKERLMRHAF